MEDDQLLTPQQKAARTTRLRHGKDFFNRIGQKAGLVTQQKRREEGRETGFEIMAKKKPATQRKISSKGGRNYRPSQAATKPETEPPSPRQIKVVGDQVIDKRTNVLMHTLEEPTDPMAFIDYPPKPISRLSKAFNIKQAAAALDAQLRNLGVKIHDSSRRKAEGLHLRQSEMSEGILHAVQVRPRLRSNP